MTRHRCNLLGALAAALALALGLAACEGDAPRTAEAELDAPVGPHGGRLLEEDGFRLELAIFERGVPPELRAWAWQDGEALDAARFEVEVELARLGGRVDRFQLVPGADFLRSGTEVREPHSFDVRVLARHAGRAHRFAYASYEGRVEIDDAAARESGIAVEPAGPARIRETIALYGRIVPDGDRTAHVTPRYPGVALEVRKQLGEPVAKDEVVAVVESNESLRPYEVRARIAGTAIAKDVVPGEFVANDAPIYVVSDLGRVWADLAVHRRDFGALRLGQRVWIEAGDGSPPTEAQLSYLSPIGAQDTQTLLARAVVPNPDGAWRPGLFATARVEVDEVAVPVAVRAAALQRLRDGDVVFVRDGDTYEAQPVELGRRDGERVEIVAGLAAGQLYVAAGSFVLKADAGKAGASHDH